MCELVPYTVFLIDSKNCRRENVALKCTLSKPFSKEEELVHKNMKQELDLLNKKCKGLRLLYSSVSIPN